jgi:[ribosomal protein S5]-alanine N-acetyltransferase
MAFDARFGFSKWLVLDRVTGEPIGDAGLLPMPDSEDFELGYRLRRDQWGKGLATEIALAWVEHAREQLRLPHLVAFTHPDHVTSQRVLEKVGFRRAGEAVVYGMPSALFRLQL